MRGERKQTTLLQEFGDVCQETLAAKPKPNRGHRRRLEAFRPKLQALFKDPEFGALAENRMKLLNVVLHYAKSGDDEQLARSVVALQEESDAITAQINKNQ